MNYFKIAAVLVPVTLCLVFFGLWRVTDAKLENARTSLKTANKTIEQHQKNIEITERVSNEYQTAIANLNSDIDRLRKLPSKCVPVTSETGRSNGKNTGAKLSEGNGVRSEYLYDFAGRCEKERQKVIGLQNFVNSLYNQ